MQENHRSQQVAQAFRFRPPLAWQAEPKPPRGKILRDVEETLIQCPNADGGQVALLYEDLIEGLQYPVGGKCPACGWFPDLAEILVAVGDVARPETIRQIVARWQYAAVNFPMAGKGVMPS